MTQETLLQRLDIDDYVGKFRQALLIMPFMRTAMSFLIGCVLGATGVLMWVHESRAAEGLPRVEATTVAGAPAAASSPSVTLPRATARALRASLLVPVAGFPADKLKSDFTDPRSGGRAHGAIDILAPRGTPVIAATDGRIRKLFTSKAGGLTIYQYDAAEELCYYYAHLDRYADGVREGMSVRAGDVIGYVGITGNAPPTAPHLHFAVTRLLPTKEWWKGEAIDPYPLLTGR